ncbi:MAG TPA: DUF6481 family protein [Sphingobium sp.]
MRGYKEPGLQDRLAAANRARDKALEKLRSKPPIDEAELARRAARQQEKDAAARAKREAAKLAKEEAAAAKKEAARLAAEAAEAAKPRVLTEEEKKAARDARYAARKARK